MLRSPAFPRQPLLCGYYGEHNLGDDALLQALLAQLPLGCDPCITAADQALVHQRFGVRSCDRRSLKAVLQALAQSDGLVFGGGSLLQDSTSLRSLLYYGALITAARLQRKPVLLWGQGLGPLRRRRSRALVRLLLPLVSAASWRDAASAELACALGRPRQPADGWGCDPVWSLEPQHWRGLNGPIVLCWRPTALLHSHQWELLLKALDEVAASSAREVLWLPFHQGQDVELFSQLCERGLVPQRLQARSRQLQATTPEQAMAVFSGAGLVLAMRLHALILGALSGAPVAALSYDPKVAAAAAALPCEQLELAALPDQASVISCAWQACLDQPLPAARIAAQRHSALVHQQLLNPQHS
ncbi:MAG: polysaccharide pyruvyl transferase CsaB [Synechococcus sp.]|nr:polysaccharide pyruvyl transferase CsaB [Synechococcus sp.]